MSHPHQATPITLTAFKQALPLLELLSTTTQTPPTSASASPKPSTRPAPQPLRNTTPAKPPATRLRPRTRTLRRQRQSSLTWAVLLATRSEVELFFWPLPPWSEFSVSLTADQATTELADTSQQGLNSTETSAVGGNTLGVLTANLAAAFRHGLTI